MGKTRLNTRKHLHRYKARVAAERAEDVKASAALAQVPRRWRGHTQEMAKMTKGCEWVD